MKQLRAIKHSKDLREKLKLAEGRPVLTLESLIEKAEFAHGVLQGKSTDYERNIVAKKLAMCYVKQMGLTLARIIASRDTQAIHQLLGDLESLKNHQPQSYLQKHIRATLIAFVHLAPEGPDAKTVMISKTNWRWKASGKKWSVKHVAESLVKSGKVKPSERKNLKRQIRREIKNLNLRDKFDQTPGPKSAEID